MQTIDFINRASNIHNGEYVYIINTPIILTKDKVTCCCKTHGVFDTRVHDHIYNMSGCPTCANELKSNKDVFVKRANEAHNRCYDYSNVLYINNYTPVEIICDKHGKFNQIPSVHLKAVVGCPQCSMGAQKKSLQEFINDAVATHVDCYDYSKVKYVNIKEKVEIGCPIHGSFLQTPDNHINNNAGCPTCANLKRSKTFNAGRDRRESNKNGNGTIYLAQFLDDDEEFVKVGITTGPGIDYRFGGTHRGYNVTRVLEYELPIKQACLIEQAVLENFKNNAYVPMTKFGGYTECFNIISKNDILKHINRMIK